jgi:hypothetical protein
LLIILFLLIALTLSHYSVSVAIENIEQLLSHNSPTLYATLQYAQQSIMARRGKKLLAGLNATGGEEVGIGGQKRANNSSSSRGSMTLASVASSSTSNTSVSGSTGTTSSSSAYPSDSTISESWHHNKRKRDEGGILGNGHHLSSGPNDDESIAATLAIREISDNFKCLNFVINSFAKRRQSSSINRCGNVD